jgi:hypothetical protein
MDTSERKEVARGLQSEAHMSEQDKKFDITPAQRELIETVSYDQEPAEAEAMKDADEDSDD